ncbi:MAG: hypothetical protein GWP19_08110 [Planctomycetia bacterium]|nr:hypothetical protein [Planctomycetia bacterium]
MRIKNIPAGSKITCNGAAAEIISHGEIGCRVKVLTVKGEHPGFCLGNQVWSNQSIVTPVEYAPGFDNGSPTAVSTQSAIEVPLILF